MRVTSTYSSGAMYSIERSSVMTSGGMRVRDAQLPADHVVEQPELVLDLQPGETRQAETRILPRPRSVQMIDRGMVR